MKKKSNKSKKLPKLDSKSKKRLSICLVSSFILLFLLVIRISWLQFSLTVSGHNLKEEAYKQQIANRTITPKRGNIYDSTGKGLALSAEVDTVSVNPSKLKTSEGKEVDKSALAKAFSDMFEVNYNETLEKLNSDSSTVKIADKIEHSKILQLEEWLKNNKITSGINIDPDTERFYPYNNLASNLIGFTGTDGHGLSGLENSLDALLSGTSGKIITTTDSVNGEIPNRTANICRSSRWL